MKILSVRVENWRALPEAEIEFDAGLNVVYGPNEAGKSSLVEAMYYAFAGDPLSARKEYRAPVPWNTKVKARVSLRFATDEGAEYRVLKAFPKGGGELYFREGNRERLIAEGKETDRELLRRLGIEEELRSLLDLLWVRQGEGLDLLEGRSEGLSVPLVRTVKEIVRGQLRSPAAERLHEQLLEERKEIFTSRGAVKSAAGSRGGRLTALREEYLSALEEEQRLRQKIEELERIQQRHEELHRESEELEERYRAAERRLQQLRNKRRSYERWLRSAEQLQPLERALTSYRQRRESRQTAAQRLTGLRQQLSAAVEREMEDLRSRIAEQRQRERQLEELERELADFAAIERSRVERAEQLSGELGRTETLLERQPLRVEITPYRETRLDIAVDGGERESLSLTDPFRRTLSRSFFADREGEFSIAVTGPLSEEEFSRLQGERGSMQEELTALLQESGCETPAQLREKYEELRQKRGERDSLRALAGRDEPQQLQARLEELETKRQSLQEKLPADASEEAASAAAPGASVAELERRIAREESSLESAAEGMREALEQVDRQDAESLERELEQLRRDADEKRRELEAIKPREVEKVDDAVISRAERQLEELNSSLRRSSNEKARLEGAFDGEQDYTEALAGAEYRRRSAAESLRQEWSDVYALDTLLALISEEKEELERHVYRPLEEKIRRRFAELTEERYSEVRITGELGGLGVAARTYDGSSQEVDIKQLSFGTREQLSFLFRLALGETLSERQKQTMVLDDSFVNSDERRLKWLLEESGRAAQQLQCILFTCTDIDDELLPEGTRRSTLT
jgi:DNA repair exonuclease SbcCD ATPase subunit